MVPIRSWQQTRSGSSICKSFAEQMVLDKLNHLNPQESMQPYCLEYLTIRESIIAWVEPVATKLGYSASTFFQSLHLIDKVFSQLNI